MSTMHDAAQDYRARGWHVIPARPRDKRPAVPSWREYQTDPPDPDQIAVWWDETPAANVAVLTGRGLVVVDLDGRGAKALLEAEGIEIPDGAGWAETGNGWHVYLAAPAGVTIGNAAGILRGTEPDPETGKLPQVDVRGDGGYVIAPPSIHPNGRPYRWAVEPGAELPEIPAKLLDLCNRRSEPAAKVAAPPHQAPQVASEANRELWVAPSLQGVGEGQRDDTCAKLAGYFVEKLPVDIVCAILHGFGDRCAPPLPHDDVDRVVESVAKKAESSREIEVVGPLSTGREFRAAELSRDATPGVWGDIVDAHAPWTEAHPASIVLPALAFFGVFAGEGVRVGNHRPIEYVAVVGPTSTGRKDTGVDIAESIVDAVGGRSFRVKHGAPGSGEGIWYGMRDAVGKDPGAPDKRLALRDTEMGTTLAVGHRTGNTTLPALCSLWDNGTKETLTKRDTVVVTNGHFGYVGCTVPDQLARLLTFEDRHSGLAQRFLFAAVSRVRTVPASRATNMHVDLESFAERLRDRIDDATRSRHWRLSGEASARLDQVADSLVDPARPETARGAAHVIRLAMLYCLTVPAVPGEEAGQGVVALSHLRAAEAAWRYCSESAALLLSSDNLVDKVVALARDAGDGLNRTALFKATGNNVTASELDEAIERGRQRGLLRVVEERTGRRGRPMQKVQAV